MKKAKIFIIVLVVCIAAIAGVSIYVGQSSSNNDQKTPISQESEKSSEEADKKDESVSTSEEMSAVVSEEGVPTLNYTNMSCVSGMPDLVIPAKKDDIKVNTVNLTWLHSSENQPVTYLLSLSFEEGIKVLDSSLCYVISLQKVSIPKSMKSIPDKAFEDCQDTVTLMVVKGSYGEKYAKKQKLKFEYQKKGE